MLTGNSIGTSDHSQMLKNGFRRDPNGWCNVEMTIAATILLVPII
jgi:hypothetical protein